MKFGIKQSNEALELVLAIYANARKEVEPSTGKEVAAGRGTTMEGHDLVLYVVDDSLDDLQG